MAERQVQRELRHRHWEWWVVSAVMSVGLLVVAGVTAAAGLL